MDRTVAMRAPKTPKTPRQPGVALLPPRAERTHIEPAVAAGKPATSFADDLAIFAAAMNKNTAALLGTLSADLASRAQNKADELRAMSSADRRAKVAATFAPKTEATQRLRAVLSESGPLLRCEIFSQLPPWLRGEVADIVRTTPSEPVPPLVKVLAARLIRESTR